ncbi:hypothetical protein D3C87_2008140 [compost metagenome]
MTRPRRPKNRPVFTAVVCGIICTYVVPVMLLVCFSVSMVANSLTGPVLPVDEP